MIAAGIAVLNKDAFITCVYCSETYTNELNKPTLVSPRKSSKGKLFRISFFLFSISLYVKGNNINQTVTHLKKTSEKGEMLSTKANFPIMKFPAQKIDARTSIT